MIKKLVLLVTILFTALICLVYFTKNKLSEAQKQLDVSISIAQQADKNIAESLKNKDIHVVRCSSVGTTKCPTLSTVDKERELKAISILKKLQYIYESDPILYVSDSRYVLMEIPFIKYYSNYVVVDLQEGLITNEFSNSFSDIRFGYSDRFIFSTDTGLGMYVFGTPRVVGLMGSKLDGTLKYDSEFFAGDPSPAPRAKVLATSTESITFAIFDFQNPRLDNNGSDIYDIKQVGQKTYFFSQAE